MSTELIGIIAAAITLGTAMFAAMRGIRRDILEVRTELREEMRAGHNAIREEMKTGDNSIRDEMKAGFKELTARMVDIGDRLSKIEGIIEGLFWSSRNQPPDKPREGVA